MIFPLHITAFNKQQTTGYDVNYQAILDKGTLNGDTLPSSTVQDAQNQLVLDMKSIGFWALIDSFWNWCPGSTSVIQFRLMDWKSTDYGSDISSNLIYNADSLQGNSAGTGYFRTLKSLASYTNYSQNDACRGAIRKSVSGGREWSLNGTAARESWWNSNSPNHRINQNLNANDTNYNSLTDTGLIAIGRYSSTDIHLWHQATVSSRVSTSTAVSSNSMKVFSMGTHYSDSELMCFFEGAYINDTIMQDFRTAFNTYLTTLGYSEIA